MEKNLNFSVIHHKIKINLQSVIILLFLIFKKKKFQLPNGNLRSDFPKKGSLKGVTFNRKNPVAKTT